MTLAELVEECKSRVAEHDQDWFNDNNWKAWLNEGQRALVRRTRVLEKSKQTTTEVGVSQYALDKDFWVVRLVKLDNDVLYPESLDDASLEIPMTGLPYRYSIWNRILRLVPAPSSEKTLLVHYYAWPSKMVNDTDEPDVPEAFHGLLPTFAAYRARQVDGKLAEADRLLVEFNNGALELLEAMAESQDQQTIVRDVVDPVLSQDWFIL